LNKGDLIETVAAELKLSRAEACRAVDTVLESISRGIRQDSRVALQGFGTFQRRIRAPRVGVNPTTKERIQIDQTVTCAFKPSMQLRSVI
jgi:DNA-binding protein HU-beta